jgi:predicted AAA+ superfamily ATPase
LRDPADRVWLGAALETLVYHELRVYNEVSRKLRPLFFYRTPAGVEVDFIIETARRQWDSPPHVVAVEVKRAERWERVWEKHLRSLIENPGLTIDRLIGVYCGSRIYEFDNLTVFPLEDFVTALFAGEIF